MSSNYETVDETAPGGQSRWRVRDLRSGELTKGRFHTCHEAEAWIEQHKEKYHRAYLHADRPMPDIYGENLLSYPEPEEL